MCGHTHGGLTAGLMFLLIFLDARRAEGGGGRRSGGGGGLAAGGRGGQRKEREELTDLQVGCYLNMCRLSGPSRLEEDGPDAGGSAGAPLLKGWAWSKAETAMEARVLAPEANRSRLSICGPTAETRVGILQWLPWKPERTSGLHDVVNGAVADGGVAGLDVHEGFAADAHRQQLLQTHLCTQRTEG